MLRSVLDVAEPVLSASSAQSASAAFDSAMGALGTSYLQTRHYRHPLGQLTNDRHWAAGGFVARRARRGWVGSSGFHYVCFEQNPLLQPIREGRTRYRFSDSAPHTSKAFGPYWEALCGADIADALCATALARTERSPRSTWAFRHATSTPPDATPFGSPAAFSRRD